MITSLRYDVYNIINNIEFLNKNDVIKQYRQYVMTSENIDFLVL